MSFESLGLPAALLRAVQELGYTTPTPIQLNAIPAVLAGRDLLGCRADRHRQDRRVRVAVAAAPRRGSTPARAARARPRLLVLVPTRELAAQVGEAFQQYGTPPRSSARS